MFVVFMHPIWPSQIFYHWPLFKKCCFYLAFEANSATFPNCTFFLDLIPHVDWGYCERERTKMMYIYISHRYIGLVIGRRHLRVMRKGIIRLQPPLYGGNISGHEK